MAGIAGEQIGIGGTVPLIAEEVALVDGAGTSRGCTTNLIGFGEGLTTETGRTVEDFSPADDTVILADGSGDEREPVYTGTVLSWEEPAP